MIFYLSDDSDQQSRLSKYSTTFIQESSQNFYKLSGRHSGRCSRPGAQQATLKGHGRTHQRHRLEFAKATACRQIYAALFDRWNTALQSGDPRRSSPCMTGSILATDRFEPKPRLTPAEKKTISRASWPTSPLGKIDMHHIQIDRNKAADRAVHIHIPARPVHSEGAPRLHLPVGWQAPENLQPSLLGSTRKTRRRRSLISNAPCKSLSGPPHGLFAPQR